MRHLMGMAIVALTIQAALAQAPARVTSLSAPDYVGQRAIACGVVSEFAWPRPNVMTLTLAPVTHPTPLRIELRGTQLTERLDNRFLGQTVCAEGLIERRSEGLFVFLSNPLDIRVEAPASPLPPFAPEAFAAGDPRITMPVLIRDVKPTYTAAAMRAKAAGGVLLRALVTVDGHIGEVQVLRKLHPELDQVAEDALRQWEFRPGTYMGKPVPVVITAEMTFTIRSRR